MATTPETPRTRIDPGGSGPGASSAKPAPLVRNDEAADGLVSRDVAEATGLGTDTSDLPPTHTIKPIDSPPDSPQPTAAQLKGDIDSGRTGDKNPVFDPGLSPLGTDDEAAGRPPSAVRVALARHYENIGRWAKGARKTGATHNKQDGVPVVFLGFIAGLAVVFVVGIVTFAGAPALPPPR
jgi:hypothetical protein